MRVASPKGTSMEQGGCIQTERDKFRVRWLYLSRKLFQGQVLTKIFAFGCKGLKGQVGSKVVVVVYG